MSPGRSEKPKHLGRGLASLISPIMSDSAAVGEEPAVAATVPKFPPDKELERSLRDLPMDRIAPNPYQARTVWKEDDLVELADSIKANGVLQPVIVRPFHGGFQLIAGERRFRAAQLAGLAKVPALVREVSEEQLFEWSLVENIHRRDLNAIERAKAYQRYLNAFSLTQAEAAERLGEDRSVIANYLRLLDLSEDIRQMLTNGQLTAGHARAILSLPSDELRRKLANRAMAGRLSVREVERLVRRYLNEEGKGAATPRTKAPHIVDLEDKLRKQLGTHVAIEARKNGQRGRIVISFSSLDEFDRITEALGLACSESI
jgi:ParB family chromosome partitioning protein